MIYMLLLKKLALIFCVLLYIMAGVNHFWHPAFYLHIIPLYLPFHVAINYISGILEFVCGLMLLFQSTRKSGAICIIVLLLLFIPAHVYTVQIACPDDGACSNIWLPLLRLVVGQPLLIALAWWIKD